MSLSNSVANQLPFLVLNEICASFIFVLLGNDVVKFAKGLFLGANGGVAELYFCK